MLRDTCHVTYFRKRLGSKVSDPVAIEGEIRVVFVVCNVLICVLFFMEESLTPEEACRLIGEELGVERSCIRPCFDESGSRVSCLVRKLDFVLECHLM